MYLHKKAEAVIVAVMLLLIPALSRSQDPPITGTDIIKSVYEGRSLYGTTSVTLLPGFTSGSNFIARNSPDPAVAGQWYAPLVWPIVAIHTHLLPNGKVLAWPRHKSNVEGEGGPIHTMTEDAYLFDPATKTFTNVHNMNSDIFCSGHTFLPDGRLIVTGGHTYDNVGIKDANIFDFTTNTWTRVQDMNAGRWYPTMVTLANGEALVVSGTDETKALNQLPQVWQTTGGWRNLTGALRNLPLYPWMHVAPNGKVFMSGPDAATRYLNTSGTGVWEATLASTNFGYRGAFNGSSIMYEPGKVMIVGGAPHDVFSTTNRAEIIDLTSASPAWTEVTPMAFPRHHLNTTILPDGKVLATGGRNAQGYVLTPELWDPATRVWTRMADMEVFREYHSTALLLPDATVLSAGSGLPSYVRGEYQENSEIFRPPYLFKGTRPAISVAPSVIGYNQVFQIQTPNANSISQVTMISLPSVTHSFNMNQRFIRLSRTITSSSTISVTSPSSRNICPPGYYMLFILNTNGVPSVAKIVKVSSTGTRYSNEEEEELALAGMAERVDIYPTVTDHRFTLTFSNNENKVVKLIDLNGQTLKEWSFGENVLEGNVSDLAAGSYILVITNGSKPVRKRLIVVK